MCICVPSLERQTRSLTAPRLPIKIDRLSEAVWAPGTLEADLMSTELAQVDYRIVDATVKPYESS
jgi:hypothetical protein